MENKLKLEKEILLRILEYCKYLYEEEKERKNSLHAAVKTYITLLTFILGIGLGLGLIKGLPIDKSIIVSNNNFINIWLIIFFSISICCFFISLIFTILVLKIWRFERPADPRSISLKSIFMENENEVISDIIADYIIACEKNYNINESKAKLLSRGLFFLITGFILFVISFLCMMI
jgi:hypothetical protein